MRKGFSFDGTDTSKTTPSKSMAASPISASFDRSSGQSNSVYVPSKSESQSYRDKIRKRFKLIKEHAGSSLLKAQTLDLHGTMKLLQEENIQVERNIDKRAQKIKQYSRTDCYHFFCEESKLIDGNADQLSIDNDVAAEELNREDEFKDVVQNAPPEVLQDFLELAMEDSLWYPRSKIGDAYKNLKSTGRILSDEGFYVAEQRNLSNIKLLEQRLSADNEQWFNCEGKLKVIESPISGRSYRPTPIDTERFSTEFIIPKDSVTDEVLSSVHVHNPVTIQIHVTQIKFQHHALFSIEHVFARRLLQFYEKYKDRSFNNKLERLNKKLELLRSKTQDCGDAEATTHFREIKKLRELQINEGLEHRQLLKDILQTWKIIKKIRKNKKFSNTNVKLVIYKCKNSYEEEVKEFEEKINKITSEVIREKTEEYQENLQRYQSELKVWSDNKILKKPKKPYNDIDEEEIRENVAKELMEAFKPPGEPTISFDIDTGNEMANKVENDSENLRRQAVRSTKIYLKILFNDIDVCKSNQVTLNDAFTCIFNETFSIQIKDVPKSISIQIYEQPSTMMKRKLADINVDISTLASTQIKLFTENFEKQELIHYNHDGVGSGCEIDELYETHNFSPSEECILNTAGHLTYTVSCEQKEYFSDVVKPSRKACECVLDNEGHLDVTKLAHWTNQAEIDPQNPSNSLLFDYIEACKNNDSNSPELRQKYFRCNPELQRLVFYNTSKIDDNIRFRILQLRNNNEPEFVGMVVPNRIKEIPANVLTSYQKRIRHDQQGYRLETNQEENIYARNSNGQKYLKEIHIKIFQQCRSTPSNFTYEDIVNERLLLYFQNWIKVLVANFLNWFKIRPDISKPLPQLGAPKTDDDFVKFPQTTSSKLYVNVVSALNIPTKITLKKSMKSRSSPVAINVQPLSTYVRVNYDDMSLITTCKAGVNPIWEEKIAFPLSMNNIDYMSPNALNNSIIINVYTNIADKNEQKLGCNWLGFVKIPLSAIVSNGKMEGSFLVKSPIFLNYEQNLIYLNLKLKVEPNFPKLAIDMKELPCSEPPYLQKYLNKWNADYNESYPQNNFSVFAIDSTGKTVCLTRFIRPLEPPQMNLNDFDVTPDQCARYVSLIPFTDCNKLYDSIWLTTEEMLKLMVGSLTDHTIALTCFFLALNMEAWLLLGYGIPNGVTAYVLIREYDMNDTPIHYIYDSNTGNKYSFTEPLCPIQKVYCVVNESNVWANVQRTHDITLLQFDFMRRSDWHCLFNNQISAPTNSMQHKLNYHSVNNIQDFEFHIEKKLRKKILKLRKTERTTWNHYISNQLKTYIANIEYNYTSNKYDISHMKAIEHAHSIHGFVIDLPYINIPTIFEIIKASQIFEVDVSDKEYLFGVHLHMYPNQVLVIWMIIGFILPNC